MRQNNNASPSYAQLFFIGMVQNIREFYLWWVRCVRRVTTSGEIIPEIDGLRFLAIGGVFIHHVLRFVTGSTPVALATPLAMDTPGRIVDAGAYGVQLFFIISGFILGLPFAAHYLTGTPPVSLGKYYLRRVTRLEPPYVVAMLLCFALGMWVWREWDSAGNHAAQASTFARVSPVWVWLWREDAESPLAHLVASMIYSHNWIYDAHSTINPVAWSLEIEVQFYVAAPFLARVFAISCPWLRRAVMLTLIAAIMVLQTTFVRDGSPLYFSLGGFGHFFLAGFFLADVYVTDWKGAPQRSVAYDLAMVGCIFAAGFLGAGRALLPGAWHRYVMHFLALLVLLFPALAAFRSRYFRCLMGHSLLVAIGGMCYTIYLLHFALMHLIGPITRDWVVTRSLAVNLLLHTAVFAPPVLMISTCYYLAIEKPCMRKDWPVRLYRCFRTWWPVPSSGTSNVSEAPPCRIEEPIP